VTGYYPRNRFTTLKFRRLRLAQSPWPVKPVDLDPWNDLGHAFLRCDLSYMISRAFLASTPGYSATPTAVCYHAESSRVLIPTDQSALTSNSESFVKASEGVEMQLYVLRNKHGLEARVSRFGATLVSLTTPDRYGRFADVVLGYEDVAGYESGKVYLGGTIGRYANRIAKGSFCLNGETFQLAINDGANHLHGGRRGFNKVAWNAKQTSSQSIDFGYASDDGEEGYPGGLDVKVTYELTDQNELKVIYMVDEIRGKDTVVNLTNHAYFNLMGDPQNNILQHELLLNASHFTPVDSGLIPLGELRAVKGTPFDFTTPKPIGERIEQDDEQLKLGRGYDHNFVIDRRKGEILVKAAEVYEPSSGRIMEVETTEPGIQLYSGNFLDGSEIGKKGIRYGFRSGFCLETQHFPDSPNHPTFPSTTLKIGQRYASTTVIRFSVRKD
jgi:aldose 1-epimerase